MNQLSSRQTDSRWLDETKLKFAEQVKQVSGCTSGSTDHEAGEVVQIYWMVYTGYHFTTATFEGVKTPHRHTKISWLSPLLQMTCLAAIRTYIYVYTYI